MYHDQLRQEQRQELQGWQAISGDIARFFSQLRALLGISSSATLSTFTVHRVPGTDALR